MKARTPASSPSPRRSTACVALLIGCLAGTVHGGLPVTAGCAASAKGGIVVPEAATMTSARMMHAAALLNNGRVLLTGGFPDLALGSLDSAESYDPATKTFTALAERMTSPRKQHAATRLADGQVLITGGATAADGDGTDTAEIYNPASRTFTALVSRMTTPRGGHTATRLANGQVLVAGGYWNSSHDLDSAELYTPATRSFAPIAARMTAGRSGHAAALLADGRVLLTGGEDSSAIGLGAEVYDPGTQTFQALNSAMTTGRAYHTATALPTGHVALVGGGPPGVPPTDITMLDSAEIYDPVTGAFEALLAALRTARGGHTATLLPNRTILFAGGGTGCDSAVTVLDTAELAPLRRDNGR